MPADSERCCVLRGLPSRQVFLLALWAIFGGHVAAAPAGDTPQRFSFEEAHMGMPVKLVLYTCESDAANRVAREVYARFAELNKLLSDYDPESELSRLSHSSPHEKPVPVSEPLWKVLVRSQALAEQTDGAFDVTVGPMVRLWRRARRSGELPTPTRIASAQESVGYKSLKLDESARAAQLLKPNMQLDLGGIAAGYAVDEGLAITRKHGITAAMIDASGDIGVTSAPPGTKGWRIGIVPLEPKSPPSMYLLLENGAVTTSGDAFQFVEVDGKRYSHIVDPKTGMGMTGQMAVTVVAPDCITADSVATAVTAMGPKAGMEFIEKHPDKAALILRQHDGKTETIESTRWSNLSFDSPTEDTKQ